MILYSLLCFYVCQMSLVTACKLDILQVPETVKDVPPRSPVQFTCTTQGTCNVSMISVETPKTALMMWNLSGYIIPNRDIDFRGTLTNFTITMNVNESNRYYCGARWQTNGQTFSGRSNGILVTVKDAGLTVSVNMQLLFLALLSLVCIYVGI